MERWDNSKTGGDQNWGWWDRELKGQNQKRKTNEDIQLGGRQEVRTLGRWVVMWRNR